MNNLHQTESGRAFFGVLTGEESLLKKNLHWRILTGKKGRGTREERRMHMWRTQNFRVERGFSETSGLSETVSHTRTHEGRTFAGKNCTKKNSPRGLGAEEHSKSVHCWKKAKEANRFHRLAEKRKNEVAGEGSLPIDANQTALKDYKK